MLKDATELCVCSFDTSAVTDITSIFENVRVTTIYDSNKLVINCGLGNKNNMFNNATNLVGGNNKNYSLPHKSGEYAQIEEAITHEYFNKDKFMFNTNGYDDKDINPSKVKKIVFSTYDISLPAYPKNAVKLINSGGLRLYYYLDGQEKIILVYNIK